MKLVYLTRDHKALAERRHLVDILTALAYKLTEKKERIQYEDGQGHGWSLTLSETDRCLKTCLPKPEEPHLCTCPQDSVIDVLYLCLKAKGCEECRDWTARTRQAGRLRSEILELEAQLEALDL